MARTRTPSVKKEMLQKSREAALNAVQAFNNPLTTFKTETFIVLMVIAWTYLLHAYYRSAKIEYRYYSRGPKRRRFKRDPSTGAFRYWELKQCLNEGSCPLDKPTKNNLLFLIGLRNEIEHHQSAVSTNACRGAILLAVLTTNATFASCLGNNIRLAPWPPSRFSSATLQHPLSIKKLLIHTIPSGQVSSEIRSQPV